MPRARRSNPPYPTATWAKIQACGRTVEAALRRHGVELTMGGEPTFVPLVPEGAEWKTAALGPTKLIYARRMASKVIRRMNRGALMLETQGKLFPGEDLPRWALVIQHRADGRPLWRDPSRLRAGGADGNHRLPAARRTIQALCRKLDLQTEWVLPLAEPRAPATDVGYVLPLDAGVTGTWISDDWRPALGRGPLPLLPGGSAAGLRLPLAALGEANVRRALTVEIRAGLLTVFIPPLLVEPYERLLAIIEDTLAALDLRDVVLAGYAPPPDPMLPTLALTSDPGVLEVNMTPCGTWADYDAQLGVLFTAAQAVGLCARKLNYNGNESGTGGGAHLVFGGPPDRLSPFFAFPHLLPSIVRYWQRHPALSYGFTGAYLGPGSQAPRIDESGNDAPYELEIACAGAELTGSPDNPALFDLLFRDLLADRSGNTHRAEISIDKLWNPHAANGRLGVLEFRAFESHPLRAVQSATALFVRAILARLCRAPCRAPFIRWAGELHDRFFLPACVWEDLSAICGDLAKHDLGFDPEWLRPAWNWRFPRLGTLALAARHGGGRIEFRQALEAWPLLGESPDTGTVIRRVDSSVDRIEARITDAGLLERGRLLVNGLPCGFLRTRDGGAVAGIRFRAFDLRPALHPHVPSHAPLLLEWVERRTRRVVAAARWHVWSRSSRGYTHLPASAGVAARRRADRWQPWTATLGETRSVPTLHFPPESRYTLDLRRYPAPRR